MGLTTFAGSFTNPPEQPVEASPRLHLAPDSVAMIDPPRQNRGRLACWGEWGFGAGAPLWTGDVPQARAARPEVVVERVERTQNTFTIALAAQAPGRVLVNSTYDKGWRSDVGVVGEQNKQLVLDVPAGRHVVHLRYRPKTFLVGSLVTLVSMGAVVAWFVYDHRRRRALV